MKRTIIILVLLLNYGAVNAQKLKMKNGKVFVDKKEYLTYDGDVFYSLDGVRLFTLVKGTVEVENPLNKPSTSNSNDAIGDRARVSTDNGLRRDDRYTKPKKVKYVIVSFNRFKLEYETTLTKLKILKEFYNSKVINIAGVVDQRVAKAVSYKISKDITGKRPKID